MQFARQLIAATPACFCIYALLCFLWRTSMRSVRFLFVFRLNVRGRASDQHILRIYMYVHTCICRHVHICKSMHILQYLYTTFRYLLIPAKHRTKTHWQVVRCCACTKPASEQSVSRSNQHDYITPHMPANRNSQQTNNEQNQRPTNISHKPTDALHRAQTNAPPADMAADTCPKQKPQTHKETNTRYYTANEISRGMQKQA